MQEESAIRNYVLEIGFRRELYPEQTLVDEIKED